MADISTSWMGLKLKSPLIIASSGLTNSLKNIKEYEKQGAGAIVLKSLFEEQILNEAHHTMGQDETANQYPEAMDYILNYSRTNALNDYLKLISDCKKETNLPIIGSINCSSASEWTAFAADIEKAGADALELNVYIPPFNPRKGQQLEKIYFEILQEVALKVKIPVALKIGSHFTSLTETAEQMVWAGAKGLVLFNKFYSPDIDINNLKIIPANVFSTSDDIHMPLRWVALLSGRIKCDIAGTTGVHNGEDLIKMLLAGAKAVEIASAVYKNGPEVIGTMLNELNAWMEKNKFATLNEVIGKLNYQNIDNPSSYERVQFMKHFAGIE